MTKLKETTSFFSEELKVFIEEGKKERQRFLDLSEDIKRISPNDSFPHFYIYSQAGLGKSYTVKSTFEKAGIKNYTIINGGLTMNGFINEIAVIVRQLKKNEHFYVYLEDCTGLFNNEENCNIMKNVLRDEKKISYHKNPTKILGDATPLQREALTYFMSDNNGINIPTNKLIFIFTSNRKLPTQDEIRRNIDNDLYAIRSRVNPVDFYMKPTTMWGYITDIILTSPNIPKSIPQTIKVQACQFLWDNWSNFNSRSIREMERMIEKYEKYPKDYMNKWSNEFIKK
jgi:hypothetical protein